ncbi:restriction endonuclease [Halorubrum aidingense JCM 13560]|uniref:Restriction endonuclease n=1 Tax=Halorubrum aidingense JCM 13560 TaxID=1230454 RepID=M0PKR4_9EURY|nr:hypothetical protein [Halorubrum aidingense]EMA70661.1 restriction endonuclease [Halorubrum aidingense JCM 13560]
MTPPFTVLDRIQALDGDELPEFLASLWQRAGWTVDAKRSNPPAVVVRRAVGEAVERAVLHPVISSGLTSIDDVDLAIDRGRDRSADRVMLVSTTGFTPDARRLTDAYGVDTMGPEGLARVVVALGADDLFDRHRTTDAEIGN